MVTERDDPLADHRREEDRDIERARADAAAEQAIKDAYRVLHNAINGSRIDARNILANLVADEHPTLSGQFGKAVALGIMRRSVREEFRPFDSWEHDCREKPFTADNPPHPEHDGRHSCQLVIGAMLMAQQFYV